MQTLFDTPADSAASAVSLDAPPLPRVSADLYRMAEQMFREAQSGNKISHILEGVRYELWITAAQHTLSLVRVQSRGGKTSYATASTLDLAKARLAFGIPEDADRTARRQTISLHWNESASQAVPAPRSAAKHPPGDIYHDKALVASIEACLANGDTQEALRLVWQYRGSQVEQMKLFDKVQERKPA